MNLERKFEAAVIKSRTLKNRPSNETLLKMYGLYKQATEGDINSIRQGGFDFKAIAKHDAWAECKGKEKKEAMQEYIDLIESLHAEQNT